MLNQIQLYLILLSIRWFFDFFKPNETFANLVIRSEDQRTQKENFLAGASGFFVFVHYILLYFVCGWILPYVNAALDKLLKGE